MEIAWPEQLAIAAAIVTAIFAGVVVVLREVRKLRTISKRPPELVADRSGPHRALDSGAGVAELATAVLRLEDKIGTLETRIDELEADNKLLRDVIGRLTVQLAELNEAMKWLRRYSPPRGWKPSKPPPPSEGK